MTMPPMPGQDPSEPAREPEIPNWARRPSPTGQLLSEERLAAYFGPKWDRVYRHKVAPFLDDPTFVPTWNWSAALVALFSPAWFLYRKLYLPFALFFLSEPLAVELLLGDAAIPRTMTEMVKPENQGIIRLMFAVKLSVVVAAGGTANWLLFRRARAAAQFAKVQGLPAGEDLTLMQRMGGVNRLATALFVALSMVGGLSMLRG